MKKGQKMRIIGTDEVVTIQEVKLFPRGRYVHVLTKSGNNLWLMPERLGSVEKKATVTFRNDENGQHFDVEFINDLDKQVTTVNVINGSPDDLKLHRGYHCEILIRYLDYMKNN